MRIWFDTEFIDDGRTIDLISIGMVREDGQTYYAECAGVDLSKASDWVCANVLPKLSGRAIPRAVIAEDIKVFAGGDPEFWAWFAAYDWVALCQLYGRMMDLPADWPMYVMDVRQLIPIEFVPPPNRGAHNALEDALWAKATWEAFMSRKAA